MDLRWALGSFFGGLEYIFKCMEGEDVNECVEDAIGIEWSGFALSK